MSVQVNESWRDRQPRNTKPFGSRCICKASYRLDCSTLYADVGHIGRPAGSIVDRSTFKYYIEHGCFNTVTTSEMDLASGLPGKTRTTVDENQCLIHR